ncbi:MAG TPA: 2-C-methyl-D-erythritol 4-phosphate cytidylyltransferase, partial [Pyrinomonadaceae bacterium]|nr:2-C-methyl-D-erythritol 4-phosphate cytidylyltransferase [Pyrinomonadaceae bacterium]
MNIAIIAAAGAGTRMASDRPKQFLLLAGTPVIFHTLKVFEQCDSIDEVIVVLPAAESAGFLSQAGKFGVRKLAR